MRTTKLLPLVGGAILIGLAGQAVLGEEEHERRGRSAPAIASDDTHTKECGACHTPYQADFLPAASWQKIMDNLNSHFGENADLGDAEKTSITKFLTENAADRANTRRGSKVMDSLGADKAPLRISELPYIVNKHREVPKKVFQNNPQVKSLSNCGVCHKGAARGNYDEDEVKIPGYRGDW